MNKGVFSSKNVQCEVKTISTFAIYCLSLESKLVLYSCLISPHGWGIVLISASLADFGLNTLDLDISFLLSLVSNANTDDFELVLCSCMISTNTTVNGPEYKEYYSCIL